MTTSQIIIHLDKESASYCAGEVIRGQVEALLTTEVKVEGQYIYGMPFLRKKKTVQ